MTEDHTFLDSDENVFNGKAEALDGWREWRAYADTPENRARPSSLGGVGLPPSCGDGPPNSECRLACCVSWGSPVTVSVSRGEHYRSRCVRCASPTCSPPVP